MYPMEINMDGSKDEDKVGAGVAIYSNKQLVKQCKYKLHNCCSNNQAEQIAILKALKQIPQIDSTGRIAAIFTDSKVTTDLLKIHAQHSFLIEGMRKKMRHLNKLNWTIHFGWVKVHIGTEGNQEADRLAKEAAHEDEDQNTVYNRILLTTVTTEINKKGIIQWQGQWDSIDKGAVCRSFFPVLEQRLKMKIPINLSLRLSSPDTEKLNPTYTGSNWQTIQSAPATSGNRHRNT
jgi:ribonuclease HI